MGDGSTVSSHVFYTVRNRPEGAVSLCRGLKCTGCLSQLEVYVIK